MRRPRRPTRVCAGALAGGAAMALAAAAALLGRSGNFALTFAYVACTLGVCACATAATIGVLARWRDESGGLVEIGLLVGLFVVSPLALIGAFRLLAATIGTP
ncbi:MAG TPA: hypothetical protein VMB84_09400 [Stellaceae bacterium]|nr:hypothetical protein [Stellaceae bacterium]